MDWPAILEIASAVLLALALIPILLLFGRGRWLSTTRAVFDCALRPLTDSPSGWSTGVARYVGDTLEWYRVFSLSFRPKHVFPRAVTATLGRREPDAAEAVALFSDHQVVGVRSIMDGQERSFELAMTPGSLTGLMSWLEAAPPGGRNAPWGTTD